MIGFCYNHAYVGQAEVHSDTAWDLLYKEGNVTALTIDQSGVFMAMALHSGVVELWDVRSIPVAVDALTLPLPELSAQLSVQRMTWSRDTSTLVVFAQPVRKTKIASAGETHEKILIVCSTRTSQLQRHDQFSAPIPLPFSVESMSFLGDGNQYVWIKSAETRAYFLVDVLASPPRILELTLDASNKALKALPLADPASRWANISASRSSAMLNASVAPSSSSVFVAKDGHLSVYSFRTSDCSFSLASQRPIAFPGLVNAQGCVVDIAVLSCLLRGKPALSQDTGSPPLLSTRLLLTFNNTWVQVLSLGQDAFDLVMDFSIAAEALGTTDHLGRFEVLGAACMLGPVASERAMQLETHSDVETLVLGVRYINTIFNADWSRLLFVSNTNTNTPRPDGTKPCSSIAIKRFSTLLALCSTSPVRPLLVIAADQRDFLWKYQPAIRSDFPGPMYPVAFTLLKRVHPHEEAEDELDLTVSVANNSNASSSGSSSSSSSSSSGSSSVGEPRARVPSCDPRSEITDAVLDLGSTFTATGSKPNRLDFDTRTLLLVPAAPARSDKPAESTTPVSTKGKGRMKVDGDDDDDNNDDDDDDDDDDDSGVGRRGGRRAGTSRGARTHYLSIPLMQAEHGDIKDFSLSVTVGSSVDKSAKESLLAGPGGGREEASAGDIAALPSLASVLPPPGRILVGEFNRKLVAQIRTGDEILKICGVDVDAASSRGSSSSSSSSSSYV